MPTLGAGGQDTHAFASTPYRKTDAVFDVPEVVSVRPAWGMARRADQISPAAQAGFGGSSNVALLPSGAWCLRPLQYGWNWELIDAVGGIVLLESTLAAVYIETKFMQQPPQLPGVTVGAGGQTSTFDAFFFKRVSAPYPPLGSGLPADVTAWPQPNQDTTIPMNRDISGKVTYLENQGWCVRFMVPATNSQTFRCLANFYFGGDTETFPTGPAFGGGGFVACFLSSGMCELYEYGGYSGLARQWNKVFEFRFAPAGQIVGQMHTVMFIPHLGDRMDIICEVSGESTALGPVTGPRKTSVGHSTTTAVYYNSALVTGLTAKANMTGMGTIRMDVRQDLRLAFQPSTLWYPTTGQIIDQLFTIPFPLKSTDKIFADMHAYIPAFTSIVAQIIDPASGAPLDVNPDGSLKPIPNQFQYFARFNLSTTNRQRTPFLYDFSLRVPGLTEERTGTSRIPGIIRNVNITGPSNDPTQESGHFILDDLTNSTPQIRYRGRIHVRLRTQFDPNDASRHCTLLEGEIPRATATRKGKTGRSYPSPQWRQYDCPMVGMWARAKDQLWFGRMPEFGNDPDAPPDPSMGGQRPPYRVTEIARYVFSQGLGVPADQLDIPVLDFRAFISGKDALEYALQPTANVVDYLQKLIRDHLGYFIVWDANAAGDAAKKRGMWRVRPPTLPPYSPIWNFVTTHPGAGKLAHVPQSFPARTSPIYTYHSWPRPPEANYVVVTNVGEILPGKGGSTACTQFAFNPKSFNFDPSTPTATDPDHPDYLGRFVPLVYYNANLYGKSVEQTKFITNWTCRRLANQVMYGQKWVRFTAPLVLVDDATDTYLNLGNGVRPLRYYDPIAIDGNTFLVHSVQMGAVKDHVQNMTVECLATDNTLVLDA